MSAPWEAAPPLGRRLVPAAALAVAAAWPGGALAFLPPVLRWPLVVAVAAAAVDRGGRRAALLERAAAALVLGTFALLKIPSLHAAWSDENAYFYMAAQAARGLVPYRDFFFAHPPVHLAVPALAFRLAGGFSEAVAQALPIAAQLLAGFLLWRAARRASPALGLLALLLHLTAYQVLMAASDLDGANLATAFTMGALLAASAGRPALAGGLGGLAIGTVLYAAAGAGAVGLLCALRGRRAGALRFAAGLGGALAVVMGAGWAAGGRGFLGGVFGFHLAKAADEGRAVVLGAPDLPAALGAWLQNLGADLAGPGAVRLLALHAPILCAAAVGAATLALGLRRGAEAPPAGSAPSPGVLALTGLAGVALTAAQQAFLAEVYPFYLAPAFPWLALLGAAGAWRLWRAAEAPWACARWGALGLAALALHPLAGRVAAGAAFPEERRRAGERVEYPWRAPEHLAALAQASRALFWEDHRVRGEAVPGYRLALWNKAYAFSTAQAIAARVRAGTSPEETLTGGSTLAPLVALRAGRRMACDEADTNQKRFAAGSLDDRAFLARALADRLRYVLASPRSHFTEQLMERDPALAARFEREAVFLDPALAHGGPVRLVLYRRRDAAPPPEGAAP